MRFQRNGPRLLSLATVLVVPASALLLPSTGSEFPGRTAGSQERAAPAEGAPAPPQIVALEDAPLEPFQRELLELAFETSSALPLVPHVKNRSRAQERVVSACLELDQPARALACVEAIANWRRGSGYGDLAVHCARRGDGPAAHHFMALARGVADHLEGEEVQDWHRERILAKVASAHVLLGSGGEADRIALGISPTEASAVHAAYATQASPETLEALLAALEPALEAGEFEQARNALEACVEVFDRFYDDAERRSRIEARIRKGWERMPALVQAELSLKLAGKALDHADSATTLALLDEALPKIESAGSMPEHSIPLRAHWAAVRHRAGDAAGAQRAAQAAWDAFVGGRERILDIDRADVLLPLAEAYLSFGDEDRALDLYAQAVEEGVHNPNSRPRAEDLASICLSMAVRVVRPKPELRARLLEVRRGLGDPW